MRSVDRGVHASVNSNVHGGGWLGRGLYFGAIAFWIKYIVAPSSYTLKAQSPSSSTFGRRGNAGTVGSARKSYTFIVRVTAWRVEEMYERT